MTREEARLILQACRPDGQDDSDPQVAAALEQAQRDPELMAWLSERCAFDAVMSDKLEQVPVPLDLEARVIAATKQQHEMVRKWKPPYLAVAASIVLVASLLLLWLGRSGQGRGGDLGALRTDLASFLKEFPRLDLETERWSEISEWLVQKAALAGVEIPAQLKKYPGIGCRELQWREKRVLLICRSSRWVWPAPNLDSRFSDCTLREKENKWGAPHDVCGSGASNSFSHIGNCCLAHSGQML